MFVLFYIFEGFNYRSVNCDFVFHSDSDVIIYSVYFVLVYKPTSILASNRTSVFFVMVLVFLPSTLTLQHRTGADVFQSIPVCEYRMGNN